MRRNVRLYEVRPARAATCSEAKVPRASTPFQMENNMIQRNPILAARRNPTMVANPRQGRMIHRARGKDIMHYIKNPGDMSVPGTDNIKLIPLGAGALGGIFLSEAFAYIPYLNKVGASNKYIAGALPGLFTVAASWGIHKYLGPKNAFVKEMSGLMAVVGAIFVVKGLAQTAIADSVKSVASSLTKSATAVAATTPAATAAAVAAAGMSGGGFRTLSGGGFVPALSGGQFNNYVTPFNAVEGTALSGFVMSGGTSSDRPPLGLGARHGVALGGIDLKDFAE